MPFCPLFIGLKGLKVIFKKTVLRKLFKLADFGKVASEKSEILNIRQFGVSVNPS